MQQSIKFPKYNGHITVENFQFSLVQPFTIINDYSLCENATVENIPLNCSDWSHYYVWESPNSTVKGVGPDAEDYTHYPNRQALKEWTSKQEWKEYDNFGPKL